MRGFLAGTLTLIVLEVALQPNAAKQAAAGSNMLVQLLRRMLSASVAGLPARKTSTTTGTATTPAGGGTITV